MLKEVIQKPVIPAVHMKAPNPEHPHRQDLKHIHQSVKNLQ